MYFKYFEFLITNLNHVLGFMHIHQFSVMKDIILPVGISFYIFQALSYTIDVYRNEVCIEKNFVRYALYVAFFPQLVAGPIERSKNLLCQVKEVPLTVKIEYDRIVNGLMLMLFGYFQKMVIADRLAIITDAIYEHYESINSGALALGVITFSLEIYCDFASYSAIAIGSAQIMGFTLMENFNVPYLSSSIKKFWGRWHISLSSYLKDYLYIPLGGNRCSKIRRYVNLMITFLVSGVWHGASWNYIVWGGIHGVLRVAEDFFSSIFRNCKTSGIFIRIKLLTKIIFTNIFVGLAWVLFRAGSFSGAYAYLSRLFSFTDEGVLRYVVNIKKIEVIALIIAILLLVFFDMIKYLKGERVDVFLQKCKLPIRWILLIIMIVMIAVFGVYGVNVEIEPFIYFQF